MLTLDDSDAFFLFLTNPPLSLSPSLPPSLPTPVVRQRLGSGAEAAGRSGEHGGGAEHPQVEHGQRGGVPQREARAHLEAGGGGHFLLFFLRTFISFPFFPIFFQYSRLFCFCTTQCFCRMSIGVTARLLLYQGEIKHTNKREIQCRPNNGDRSFVKGHE